MIPSQISQSQNLEGWPAIIVEPCEPTPESKSDETYQ
jgi:hypothetical protein